MRDLAKYLILIIAACLAWAVTDAVLRSAFNILLGPALTLALFAGWLLALWVVLRNRL